MPSTKRAWIGYHSWPRLAALVVAEHGARCHLCGQPINLALTGTRSPMRLSLDHLVPRSQHGTHEPSNLRPAHFACNSRRGARDAAAIVGHTRDPRFFSAAPSPRDPAQS